MAPLGIDNKWDICSQKPPTEQIASMTYQSDMRAVENRYDLCGWTSILNIRGT